MSLSTTLLHQFEEHQDETYRLCFSPDGNTLWSSDGTAVYQWQRSSGDSWSHCQQFPGQALDLQCTADGKMIVFWDGEQKSIRFLSYDGKEVMALAHPDQGICIDFAVSPDQRWLVRDGRDGNILLYDLLKYEWTSLGVPDRPDTADGTAGCLRFALGGLGLVFVASSYEGQIHICHFDPAHDRYAIRRILPIFGVQGINISPDGKLLAITNVGADSIRGVYLYDLERLQVLQKLSASIDAYYDLLAFSPDGQFLASSRDEGILDIWSLTTFACVASFEAHPGPRPHERHWTDTIGGLDWSTTGYIATGGTRFRRDDMPKEDRSVKIWKVEAKLV
jgi:WD40 repeat protein